MGRRTSALNEMSGPTLLGDDELAAVSGGCHGHHRRRHRREHEREHEGEGHGEGGLPGWLASLFSQSNVANIFQIVMGNTGTVNMVAGVNQGNAA